jgi:hypothetical protein
MIAVKFAVRPGAIWSNPCECNLLDRFVGSGILPHHRVRSAIFILCGSLDKGRITEGGQRRQLFGALAFKYGRSLLQIAFNWLAPQRSVVTITKAVNPTHIRENATSCDFGLDASDIDLTGRICSSKLDWVHPKPICLSSEGEGVRKVYQTVGEAAADHMGMSPSPHDLAEFVNNGEPVKPPRSVRSSDPTGQVTFNLVEGRLRYSDWVIAIGDDEPV